MEGSSFPFLDYGIIMHGLMNEVPTRKKNYNVQLRKKITRELTLYQHMGSLESMNKKHEVDSD